LPVVTVLVTDVVAAGRRSQAGCCRFFWEIPASFNSDFITRRPLQIPSDETRFIDNGDTPMQTGDRLPTMASVPWQ
jgi:hypothetical protein